MTEVVANESESAVSKTSMRQQAGDIIAEMFMAGETQPPEEDPQQEMPEPDLQNAGVPEEKAEGGSEDESPEKDEGDEIETLVDLAAAIEVDPSYLYQIKMPMSGGEDPVPLGELKDRLQEANHLRAQKTQIETDRQALQRERDAWANQAQQAQHSFMQMPQEALAARAQMVALEQAWQHMEQNKDQYEAGDYAAKRQDIQVAHGQAQQQFESVMTQMNSQAENSRKQRMLQEAQQTVAKIPEWQDRETALAARTQITQMMEGYGFSAQEVDGVYDHRILMLMNDFAKLKNAVAKAQKKIAAGKRTPKVIKAGAAPSAGRLNKQQVQGKLAAAKKSRNLRTKAEAVAGILSGAL